EKKEEKSEAKKEAPKSEEKASVKLPDGVKEIRMPLLSDTMTEGKIVSWHKEVGDKVKADDVLADVETDKATMEITGYEEGTLLYVGIPAGSAAKINQLIALVGKEGTDVTAYVNAEKDSSSKPAEKSSGEDEKEEKKEVSKEEKSSEEKQEKIKDNSETEEEEKSEGGRIKASPLAKKMAEEKGYKLSSIKGSGDGGRITKRDIDEFKPSAAAPETKQGAQQLATEQKDSYTDIPVTQMRKVIARRLSESKYAAPHFYLTMEINMDNAISAREAMNEVSDVKISFNDLVIKACAMALRKHPDVNSSWMGDFIRQHNNIHIGSAVALPEGLIVPVITYADQKSLSQIAKASKELYAKAKDKKIQPNEFSGNTFTISNLGMMDIDEFTAIINTPDSCIMAVGKIKEVVIRKNNEFTVTNVMKVTLSCDHRSVDGAVGASFLQTFKKFMETPATMLV
ncbi:MAG: pyruvate dehydrogenase complex dihydrolipoamide acetyltransferase, partial [Ferruginibacter sp.]